MKRKKLTIFAILTLVALILAFPSIKSFADSLKKVKAYQFWVNNELWFTVPEKEKLEILLDEYKNTYLEMIDEKANIKKVELVAETQIVEVEVHPDEIDTWEKAETMIYAKENEATVIEVQPGDNLWNLAKKHGLTLDELIALNLEIDPEKIYPGDKLIVKPFKPVLDVVIELENTVVETIPFKITQQKDNTMYKGEKKTLQEGVEGEKKVTYSIVMTNGYQTSLEVINEEILKEPVSAIIKVGTKTTVSRGGKVNYGVVQGSRISSSYGYRIHPITGKRTFHSGVDIAASYGNGVYAYSSGKVVEARYNGSYGNNIVIDHGNGLKTRYAHLSKISVKVGQRVETGQRIGLVGSSGASTGPHLHFEVIKNGQTKNPLNYI
ncbi:MAG: M23 family metallopeptidase [Clostridia bacterium]|nr:M23 family metallopeptidase [Clostridia bacterium]